MNKKPHSLQPHAKMLLSSLRSMGYTDETAISDIIDNSISSEASEIQIYFDWENQRIIIADNGNGMSFEELLNAMEIGSADPAVMRASEDLGRFGMGMKTASFSIGKSLYVISKQNSSVSNAEWDLDYVEKNDEWEVLIHPSESITEEIDSVSDLVDYSDWDQGTLIILSKLDKLIDENNIEKSKKKFYKTIKNISAHIAMIFHRFIEDNDLTIKVNGMMALGDYGQVERNKWRYQYGSTYQFAWDGLFHKSANSGFDNTKSILISLLDTNEEFTNEVLKKIADDYLQECESNNLYPFRYYYIKYREYRPGAYGKMHNNSAAANPYMFLVMQTRTQMSQNSYYPYLKVASEAHLSKDDMGQRLIFGDEHIICTNNSYLRRKNVGDEIVDTIVIPQNEDGIDTEDRITLLKNYIKANLS